MSRRVELVLLHGSSASIPLHLERMISSYLGPAPNMTLCETCSFSSIALLDWMWEASCPRASERTPWWSLTNFLRSEPHYYRYQFAESMKVAATCGDLAVVEWLLERFRGCVVPGEAVGNAAYSGHVRVLKLLWDHENGQPDRGGKDAKKRKVVTRSGAVRAQSSTGKNEVCWEGVAGVGVCHPDVVRWLHEHFPPKSADELEKTIGAALDKDDLELAKFLLPPGRCLLDYAEFSTNPRMIEWMLDCGYLLRDAKVAVYAIRDLAGRRGNLPLMQRIAEQHKLPECQYWYSTWSAAMYEACEWGQLKVFQWLAEHPTGALICEDMKRDEDKTYYHDFVLGQIPAEVDFLQYLYDQGLFVEHTPEPVFPHALNRGQPLEVLQWLADHLPDPERLPEYGVMDEAAASGRLEVVQYFQRLQLSAYTRNAFARSDEDADPNIDVPLWCSTMAKDMAAAKGHFKVVKWLHVSRPEGCTVAAMDGAARNGHLEIVKWLHVNRSEGCTVAAMDRAAANGHLKILKWLHANRNARCTTKAMDNAARRGYLEVIKWLHANMSAGCTARAMDNAASRGHLETLLWLHGNTSESCTVEAINNALQFRHFREASWLYEPFPQYVPAKVDEWIYDDHSFEELLFRQEHYGGIFTSDYLQGLKVHSRKYSRYEKGEAWSWVKEKFK